MAPDPGELLLNYEIAEDSVIISPKLVLYE